MFVEDWQQLTARLRVWSLDQKYRFALVCRFASWVLIFGLPFSWYVCITYWNNVTPMFCFHLSLWRIFITSQLHYLFVQRITFFDDVRITLNYGNCWNVWITYRSYAIKWPFFSYIIFLAHQLLDDVDIFDNANITFIVVCLH